MRPIIGIPVGYTRADQSSLGLPDGYSKALLAAGGTPVLIPPMPERHLDGVFALLHGLLLAGGGDVAPTEYGETDGGRCIYLDRRRDTLEIALTRWALAERKPILGICRGIQTLNVAAGGTLHQDIPTAFPQGLSHRTDSSLPRGTLAHPVCIARGSRLADALGVVQTAGCDPQIQVNSRHHQAVKDVADGFVATGHAPDGMIEAIEASPRPCGFALGVQWHPENLYAQDEATRRLFATFVDACAQKADPTLAASTRMQAGRSE